MAKQQPCLYRKNNRSIDELGHCYGIGNNRRVVLTDPDRAVMADSNGFLSVAGLRTFIAAHNSFLLSFLFYELAQFSGRTHRWSRVASYHHPSRFLRTTDLDIGEHATVPFSIDPKCDVNQLNKHRD